jgi:hypothetical protein
LKILGICIIALSGYWLTIQFDLNSFLWVLFGVFLIFAEDIIRGIFNGKRKRY